MITIGGSFGSGAGWAQATPAARTMTNAEAMKVIFLGSLTIPAVGIRQL